MKIQVDTTKKTVKLLENTNLSQFVKFVKNLLGEEYNKFTLETAVEYVYWQNPIYIPYVYQPIQPYNPWPIITYSTGSADFSYVNGDLLTPSYTSENHDIHIYNFDIQEQSIT